MIDLAKKAYEAYKDAVGGTSPITGDTLPEYKDLPSAIKAGWDAAAQAVAEEIRI